MRYAALTDVGMLRRNNEDSFHADGHVFAVADGMGGHRAGEVASAVAIEAFVRFVKENASLAPLQRMERGIREANEQLISMALRDPDLEGMGTTLTAMMVENGVYLGHVGDSRAYLIRDGRLRRLTRDHSLVEKMVDEGALTPDEALVYPGRNVILRALGVSREVEADLIRVEVMPGDLVMLCSDGLSVSLEDAELEGLLRRVRDLEEGCRLLVEEANARGGVDNVTVVLVSLEEGDELGIMPDGGRKRRSRLRGFFRRRG